MKVPKETNSTGRVLLVLFSLLLLPLAWFSDGGLAGAQEVGSPFPDIDRILKAGKITVALIESERAPLVETGPEGKPIGFDVNLARRIARGLGVEAVFVRTAISFDEVIEQVARVEADLGLSGLSWTPSRARNVLFSGPYLVQGVTVFVNRVRGLRAIKDCPTPQDLVRLARDDKKVGFVSNSAYIAGLRAVDKDFAPSEFDTLDVMLESVASGEILASVQGVIAARQYLHEHKAASIRLRFCVMENIVDRLGIAVRPDAPNLARWLDQMLVTNDILFTARQVVLERDAIKF